MRLYVGNLPFSTTDADLAALFDTYGDTDAKVINHDGRFKGFGFVSIADDSAADAAVAELNGTMFQGRRLKVAAATARTHA